MSQDPLFDGWAVPEVVRPVRGGVSASAVGRMGELAVEMELLRRGHSLMLPTIDIGVDLLVDCRWRVQVKTSSGWVEVAPGHRAMIFHRKGNRGWDTADVWVFVGLENLVPVKFWVVPAEELGAFASRRMMNVLEFPVRGSTPTALFARYLDAWHVFDSVVE